LERGRARTRAGREGVVAFAAVAAAFVADVAGATDAAGAGVIVAPAAVAAACVADVACVTDVAGVGVIVAFAAVAIGAAFVVMVSSVPVRVRF